MTGWGEGYQYNCIHSGTIRTSGDLPTSWYNYGLASAGTIVDKNTDSEHPATNVAKATESICPKGWTLPTTEQININRDISSFSPVLSGTYANGNLNDESIRNYWWGSEAYNGARRYYLYSNDRVLSTNHTARYYGFSIRCVPAP